MKNIIEGKIKELEERIESNNKEIKHNFSRIEGIMYNWREKDINDMSYEAESIAFATKEIQKRQNYNFIYKSQLNELKSWLEDIEEDKEKSKIIEERDKIDNGKRYSFDEIKNDIKNN